MRVWIGLKQNEAYVHEWTGEIAEEGDIGQAIGNAIAALYQEQRQGDLGGHDHDR